MNRLIPAILSVSLLALSALRTAPAYATELRAQFVLCDAWSEGAKACPACCIDPQPMRRFEITIRRVGSNKLRVVPTNGHGMLVVSLRPGIYQVTIPDQLDGCVDGNGNGCRGYDLVSRHDIGYGSPNGPGRTLAIQGKTRRAVIKFYERWPV